MKIVYTPNETAKISSERLIAENIQNQTDAGDILALLQAPLLGEPGCYKLVDDDYILHLSHADRRAADAAREAAEAQDGFNINHDGHFDVRLDVAKMRERRLARILLHGSFEFSDVKIELKSESWQWEDTRNICIEYKDGEKLSGIANTEANWWVHELLRNGETLVYLLFPTERLKELTRHAIRRGKFRENCGENGRMSVALIRLKDILG